MLARTANLPGPSTCADAFAALEAENARLRAKLASMEQYRSNRMSSLLASGARARRLEEAGAASGSINQVLHWAFYGRKNCYPTKGAGGAYKLTDEEHKLDVVACKQLCSELLGCDGIVYGNGEKGHRCYPIRSVHIGDCLDDRRFDVYVKSVVPRAAHLVLGSSADDDNCSSSPAALVDSLCHVQSVHPQTCDSMMTCSLSPPVRRRLLNGVAPWWSRSEHTMFHIGRPDVRLLVPIRKLGMRDASVGSGAHEAEEADPTREAPEYAGGHGSRDGGGSGRGVPARRPRSTSQDHAASTRNRSIAALAVGQPPALFPPWPARGTFDEGAIAWERFNEGDLWRGCRAGSQLHWYCSHLGRSYYDETLALFDACIDPIGIFGRADVRLVLDVGGSTGAFAEAVHRRHGDRVLVVTSQLWAAENDDR